MAAADPLGTRRAGRGVHGEGGSSSYSWRLSERLRIFEPCWETGTAVRWRIQQPGEVPMGIAGIYRRTKHPKTGEPMWSFSMLTINADGHPVFKRMHRPTDEKRMVVILAQEDYGAWLSCTVDEARGFWKQWTGPLDAFPAPLPARTRKAKGSPPPAEAGLLDD